MQQFQSKESFVQSLQGSIAKVYKRKKLKNLPGSQPNKSEKTESTDMEIEMDNDESHLIFDSNNTNFLPSVPPLPQSITSSISPPLPPPLPQTMPSRISPPPPPPPTSPPPLPPASTPSLPQASETLSGVQKSSSSIITPINSSLTDDYENITLEELNANRLKILNDLNNSSILDATIPTTDDSLINDIMELEKTKTDIVIDLSESYDTLNESSDNMNNTNNSQYIPKETIFGTPLLKQVSEYNTTPDGDKWSVGVSDIIDFENLPESTGTYSKMRTILGKVRSIVNKLNEE